jgi:hypothetical protein
MLARKIDDLTAANTVSGDVGACWMTSKAGDCACLTSGTLSLLIYRSDPALLKTNHSQQ